MEIIRVKDLKFSYQQEQEIVKGINFSIEEGSYTTIIGHNGSGKSTVAKLLMGLLEASEGTIFVKQQILNDSSIDQIREHMKIVFQNPDNQFIGATVADDIAFGLENQQVPQEQMQEMIEYYAKQVGMDAFLQSEPSRLSGGQKQRVAIAGVLAMKPSILIFDEATSMLDPQGKQEILNLIRSLHKKTNITVVSITHDIEEVAESDAVIVMDHGEIIMQGKPEDIFLEQEKLKASRFDIPFSLKVSNYLKQHQICNEDCITMEQVVNMLCQLHIKK